MMSEKEREREEKEEEVILLHHFIHEHPLTLVESRRRDQCNGCGKYLTSGEDAYGCSKKCGDKILLHEECVEMPSRIRHPMHPQHILTQRRIQGDGSEYPCAVCGMPCASNSFIYNYYCASCSNFSIHLGCVMARMGVMNATDDEHKEKQSIEHASHPAHELRLLRRNRRSCSFKCDACGTMQKGNSYICSICQYWIHETCASLPETMQRESHHHSLSLAFYLPLEYIKFESKCDICSEALLPKYWVYHCERCRYVVHIKCAIKISSPATTSINDANAAGDKDVIQLPINDVAEELIKPFVLRQGGEIVIPCDEDGKYRFHNHHHQLNLISLEERVDDDDDGGDDHHLDDGRSKLICDGCMTPIYQKKTQLESSSSISSSDKYKYYYMSCGECKYVLHLACFNLPPHLPSLPLHHQNHKLILQTSPKFDLPWCRICDLHTDGLFYACTEKGCYFKADIKCACLPDTIKLAAHPKHYFKLVINRESSTSRCIACGDYPYRKFYTCDGGEFSLHYGCALLPAANKHRRDKHPLPLTYDGNINHPSEFYCDICEEKMNPKSWMYHCHECDQSFHPRCLPATSGTSRNIKFGQQYVIATCHDPHHPLTYQLITTKPRCDLCHHHAYGYRGFVCELCDFVMCFFPCGDIANSQNAIEAIP